MLAKTGNLNLCVRLFCGKITVYITRYAPIPQVNGTSGQDVAFDDLFRRAFSFAHGLREQGFRQGDVYMSFLPNTIDYVVAFLGVVASGGVFTAQHPKNIKGNNKHSGGLNLDHYSGVISLF